MSVVILLAAMTVAQPAPAADPSFESPPSDAARGLVFRDLRPSTTHPLCAGAFEVLHPRTGSIIDCTHGPDAAPAGVNVAGDTPPLTPQEASSAAQIACEPGDDGTSGKRVQAIYAYETDEQNRFSTYEDSIRAWAGNVDQIFVDSAAKTGGERHLRWVSDGACNLDIDVVAMDPGELGSFSSMRSGLISRGYNANNRKYHVWADSSVYCGIASIYNDDSTSNNAHDGSYDMHARTDRGCWGGNTEAHEIMHNLGGVQISAPHTTGWGYWHCYDEYDLMCYPDGGQPAEGMWYRCTPSGTHGRLFDCGDDDYFHTTPASGSYLDTHWNTADSSFLFVTAADPTPPPATPSDLAAAATGPYGASVTWTDNADDETGYKLQRKVDGSWSTVANLDPDTTAYGDSDLVPSTTYSYRVRAQGQVDHSDWSDVATVTTEAAPPPETPTDLSAVATGSSSITLAWSDNSTDETGFQIERQAGGDWSVVATADADTTQISNGGLDPATGYTYRVRALRGGDASDWSNTATATTDDVAPVAPQDLTATAVDQRTVDLTWTDAAGNEDAYKVQRAVKGASFTTLATLGAGAESYTDTTAEAGTTYTYRVRASNEIGPSPWTSREVSTPMPTARDIAADAFDLILGSEEDGEPSDTAQADGSAQVLREVIGGDPVTDMLEARWTFVIDQAAPAQVVAEAWAPEAADGDTFDLEYSLDDGETWSPLFSITDTEAGGDALAASLPDGTVGSVVIRLSDTARTPGGDQTDAAHVDLLVVRLDLTGIDAPVKPPRDAKDWSDGPSGGERSLPVDRKS